MAIAAGLRFAFLGHHSLWSDEAFVAWTTRLEWKDLFFVLAATDAHPPLYYALIKAWTSVAGAGEIALRTPSAVLSSLTVVLTYALARRLASEWIGLLTALLVAASPFAVMAGQEARMYPLLGALAVGSTLALLASVERNSIMHWAAYTALGTLMVYTHYVGTLVLLAHGVWLLGWGRRTFGAWLASVTAVTVLFGPWLVPMASRAAGVAHLSRSAGSIVPFGTPDDLLALFAFGGSLFGTATYFEGGTSGAAKRVIVLLPFAIVLWRGVVSLWPQRKTLALVGLPLAVIAGIGLPLLQFKAVLWPRAYSFLLPFYAVFLAHGIAEIGRAAGRYRTRAAVLLTVGLLLYSVPVLGRYYFDPAFRPFHWREAAALLRREARAGDFFLYVGRPAADSVTYYYAPPYPSRTLLLRPDPRPTFTSATARQLARQHRRVWLIMSTPFTPTHPAVRHQLFPALAGAFDLLGGREFSRTWVYLLESRARLR